MNTEEIKNGVLQFITKNPGCKVDAIKTGTKTSDILVRGAIKALERENLITVAGDKSYSLQSKSQALAESTAKSEVKAAKKKEDEDLGPRQVPGGSTRDVTRYKFNGQGNLSKSRLVHLMVKTYVEKNPKVTLAKLQEVFHSEELQPRFGVVAEISIARKYTKNQVDRYFLKADELIRLSSGTRIATCNQWNKEGLDKLIKIVASPQVGFKIKIDTAE